MFRTQFLFLDKEGALIMAKGYSENCMSTSEEKPYLEGLGNTLKMGNPYILSQRLATDATHQVDELDSEIGHEEAPDW